MTTVSDFIAKMSRLVDEGELDPHSEITFLFDSENPETTSEFFVVEDESLDEILYFGDTNQTVIPVRLDQRDVDDF